MQAHYEVPGHMVSALRPRHCRGGTTTPVNLHVPCQPMPAKHYKFVMEVREKKLDKRHAHPYICIHRRDVPAA